MAKTPLGRLDAGAFGILQIPRLERSVLEGFQGLGELTGTTSDALDEPRIASMVDGVNVRVDAFSSPKSGLAAIEAHNLAEPGDVLVVQGIANISSMGGVSASVGKRQGEAGAVVDGAVRDIDHSRKIGYPVWCTSVSPITGKWRVRTVAVNREVAQRLTRREEERLTKLATGMPLADWIKL